MVRNNPNHSSTLNSNGRRISNRHAGNESILSHFNASSSYPAPNHTDTITPFFSITTSNLNGASENENSARIRRSRLHANFNALKEKFDVNCYVDTRLHPKDFRAFKKYNIKGKIIYNNRTKTDSDNNKAGGTFISLSPYISNNYTYNIIPLPDICQGYAQVVFFNPKNASSNRLPFCIMLFYLPTGALSNPRRNAILEAVMHARSDRPNMLTYALGDWNFVEHDIDTSSSRGRHKLSPHDRKVWEAFINQFNLTERHQPGHTYYNIPKQDVSLIRTSRLDRIYTSHSEVDFLVARPIMLLFPLSPIISLIFISLLSVFLMRAALLA